MKRVLAAAVLTIATTAAWAQTTLLNVSYDVMRDFYKDYNPAFTQAWKAKTGQSIAITMSHGGSSRQARAVVDGLDADVITMNQSTDIDLLVQRGALVAPDWAKRLPHGAAPFSSASVFLVRKGNPKGIQDWADLVKPGVRVIVPNPKTSGNGRYTYLSAWAYATRQTSAVTAPKDAAADAAADAEAAARRFVTALFKNVPVLDTGGRGATTTFIQRGIGDVLVTFENEAEMVAREFGRGGFDVVYPSLSILVEPPVAVVDKVVDRKGTRAVAQAYLEYLYSPQGQTIAAENYLRPRDPAVLKQYAQQFPTVKLLTVDEAFGGWAQAQRKHFDDGALFDQIYQPAK